ncbi:reverse transcriptase [Plakobranchus ocellatus]|uniref:Reverse transcriptase n=1 Tax=Plakobranchus ocellatus TaxID=259542 RepID=A0AAV3XWC4_9GAST|nr:reverse transcriptase [Plakobranchus ocellatus]
MSDRGTQFTSQLMEEVCRLLLVKCRTTSPYHPQCNGLVERFNATLKGMLKSGNHTCEVGVLQCAVAALVDEEEDGFEHQDQGPKIETPSLQQTQTYQDVQIDGEN